MKKNFVGLVMVAGLMMGQSVGGVEIENPGGQREVKSVTAKPKKVRKPFKPETIWRTVGLNVVADTFEKNPAIELGVYATAAFAMSWGFLGFQGLKDHLPEHLKQIALGSFLDEKNIKNAKHLIWGTKNRLFGTHDKLVDDRPVAREDLYNLQNGIALSPYRVEASVAEGLKGVMKATTKGIKGFIAKHLLFGTLYKYMQTDPSTKKKWVADDLKNATWSWGVTHSLSNPDDFVSYLYKEIALKIAQQVL
jgi:hypothetical protein